MHDPASSDSGALDPSTDATLPGALDPESATHPTLVAALRATATVRPA